MPKPKQFLKENKKKSKHAAPVPTTSDEYLEAGVEFEEAGEKWRGGDAAKSTRFFVRALDCYDEGLKKFPDSFDLAYNKARLQYEITQHPKLLQHLPGTLLELLETALESSRYALKLDPEDTDALFNTAELLTEIGQTANPETKAVKLQEALWLFELCLNRQLRHFDLYEAAAAGKAPPGESLPVRKSGYPPTPEWEDTEMIDGEPTAGPIRPTSGEERKIAWARLVEPTTKDTIVDTMVVQINTLIQLIGETHPTNEEAIKYIVDYYKDTIGRVLERFTPMLGDREKDIKLAIANYECNMANLNYNSKKISLEKYEQVIMSAYSFFMGDNPQALCDAGETFVDFHDAVSQLGVNCDPYLTQRWNVLSHALDFFSMAVKLPDCEHKENIYCKRGDIELLRFQLGRDGVAYRIAEKNRQTILENAGKHYKGAKIFAQEAAKMEKFVEAELRLFLVEAFLGNNTNLMNMAQELDGFDKLLQDAVIDGVVLEEQVKGFGLEEYLK